MNKQLAETCLRYLDGDLTEDEVKAFTRLLAESTEAADLLAELALDEQHYRQSPADSKGDVMSLAHALAMPPIESTAEVETELPTIQYTASDRLTKQKYASALSYVIRHTFTPKRAAMLATAAAVLLGVVLAIAFMTIGPDDPRPITHSPEQPGPTDEPTNKPMVVAKLTAERDAVWDRRPGQDLFANQRFTLTQGFAEITTNHGAVAILEAPATIELLDNPNALRLQTGKLVGICGTESAKGFTVYTPNARIKDIGTEFGLEVDEAGSVIADVISGEIVLTPVVDRGEVRSVAIHRGEAYRIAAETGLVTPVPTQPQRFVRSIKPSYKTPDYVVAYWRFEDGTPGEFARHTSMGRDYSSFASTDTTENGNVLFSHNEGENPRFTGIVPSSTIPQTGQLNRVAVDNASADRNTRSNLFTVSKHTNPALNLEAVALPQWTVEASVMPKSLQGEQSYVSKSFNNIRERSLMLGLSQGHFFVEITDGTGTTRTVRHAVQATLDAWVHLAAVCDGKTLTLYIKAAGGQHYESIGQTPVQGAMDQASNEWNVGGARAGSYATALIDEVRICNQALQPSQFLFSYPDP
ncbi:MAG: LamG-like jellyroll fold domain-containing protein [Planctomycetota bacterium]